MIKSKPDNFTLKVLEFVKNISKGKLITYKMIAEGFSCSRKCIK